MLDKIISYWKADHARRILWLPVFFGCGIGCYFLLPSEPNKWITVWALEFLIIIAVIFRHRMRILYYLAALFLFLLGFATIQLKSIYIGGFISEIYGKTSYFKGVITNIDANYRGKTRFTFNQLEDFDGKKYAGKYRIVLRSNDKTASVGDCVELVGTIMPPAYETAVGGFQLDRKSYFDGLKGSGYAESNFFPAECGISSHGYMGSAISNIRQRIVRHIMRILPPSESSVAAAIVAGDKNLLSFQQQEQYRNAGLAHFLAISGLHMSLLSGLMFFVVRLILAFIPWISLRYDSRKISAFFALGIGLIYLFISGMAVPAQRAFIMITVVLLGIIANRRAISMYSVALAAFIILLLSPEVLISPSFQMSFAAVIGLIAFYEKYSVPIHNYLAKGNRIWQGIKLYILGIIITDFIASLSTLPFAIYHFNMVAIYTTLGNLASGPIIGLVIMPCVLFSLLLMPLGWDKPFLILGGYGIDWVNHITAFVSSLPHAKLYVPSMPWEGLLLITLGGLWLAIWQARWRVWGVYAIIAGLLSIAWVRTPDIIVGDNLKAIAFKNENGHLEMVSTRGGGFIKQAWRQRYPVDDNVAMLKAHPEFWIEGDIVTVGTNQYNIKDIIGFSAYKKGDDYVVKTIRDDIGFRPWNKNNYNLKK